MREIFQVETARFLSIFVMEVNPPWHFPAHEHADEWEFLYFTQGYGRINLPSDTLIPQQYYLVILPPGLTHTEVSNPVDPESWYCVRITVKGSPPSDADLMIPDPTGEFGWLMEHMLIESQQFGVTPLLNSYIQTFLYLVERQWVSGSTQRLNPVDAVVRYLYDHFHEPITLEELVQLTNVSKTYLVHLFTARFGLSPIRYLLKVRMEAARRLLCTTTMPITEVARQVGFDDLFHFSKAFKRIVGLSPTTFRNRTAEPIEG